MTIVKVWGMKWRRDWMGDLAPYLVVTKAVRFRWHWVATIYAVFVSQHWTICTLHREGERTNVVDLKKVREAGL